MANRDLESLYDYDYEEEDDEPYLYSPAPEYDDVANDRMTVETEEVSLPHRLEDTEYPVTPQSVPFYGGTTNRAAYTWKVPHGREKRETAESEVGEAQKIPFYSETTHRSQYQPFDASVARTRLSRKTSALPTEKSENLLDGLEEGAVLQKFWDNRNGRNVDESSGSEWKYPGACSGVGKSISVRSEEGDDASREGTQSGDELDEHSLLFRVSGLNENREISNLVWDFMDKNGDHCDDSNSGSSDE
ncbi:hypothetical protein GCK72_025526 [Caenorhabditis remanei]|uniref:Uncharacterized protein n=1 Tax=Caenorhabditis remanei TaxID=31234 RepID=A0A6A5G3D4_CAERE|nr:hypothetical protein GCK72_025526 [Caenorhabditis remanei]KAF1749059.1 hypothetical protein GCK72_025526 [Caenorhabditis remanei]